MGTGSIAARTSRLLCVAGAAIGALMLIAPAAQAGPLVASAPDCAAEDLSHPFLPWADPAAYQFAPDGGFEAGAEGWSFEGAAGTVAGHEPNYVHGAGDSRSLSLAHGSSATTPTVCVGIEHPTIRFFARRTSGGAGSPLLVEVLFETASGEVESTSIGLHGAAVGWQPSAPMPVVANLLPLLPGEHTPVAFRFTPIGAGEWRVDDLYVDPYRRS